MLDTAILHIGMHKTGTTSIQKYCFQNAKNLAKLGIFYPRDDSTLWHGHHQIPWYLTDADNKRRNNNFDLKKNGTEWSEQHTNGTLLLSSENFMFLQDKHIKALRDAIPAKKYRVILYIRKIPDRLKSGYKQHVEQFSTQYDKTVSAFFIENMYWDILDYIKIEKKWKKHFAGEVEVYSYDDQKQALVSHFCSQIDTRIDAKSAATASSNVSLNDLSIEVLRRVQKTERLDEESHSRLTNLLRENQGAEERRYSLIDSDFNDALNVTFTTQIEYFRQYYDIDLGASLEQMSVSPINHNVLTDKFSCLERLMPDVDINQAISY